MHITVVGEKRTRRERLAELLDFANETFLTDHDLAQQHALNATIEGLYSEQYWVSQKSMATGKLVSAFAGKVVPFCSLLTKVQAKRHNIIAAVLLLICKAASQVLSSSLLRLQLTYCTSTAKRNVLCARGLSCNQL